MTILEYASREQAMFNKNVSDNGYTAKTTFYSDLSIAEVYGKNAIRDTHKNVMASWSKDVTYFTEYVMALNYKAWEWYERGRQDLSQLYTTLYNKAHDFALSNFKGEDATYFFEVTD